MAGLHRAAELTGDKQLTLEIGFLQNDLHEIGAQAGFWLTYSHGARFLPKETLPPMEAAPQRGWRTLPSNPHLKCNPANCQNPGHGHPLPNPLLQTLMLANPGRTRRNGAYCEICDGPAYEAVVDDTGEHWLCPDHLKGWKLGPERIGMPSMPSRVRRGRRANPLTVAEGREISMEAVRMAQEAQGMPRPSLDELGDRLQARAFRAGRADGMVEVVKKYGPEFVRGAAPNPAVQAPPWKEGQKVPVAEARAWVVSTGDKELLRQFDEAAALQKKANRAPKHVIWQMLAIGSPRRMDAVTAMVQYGTSPETIYKPPAGSKKGSGLYRHEWGEGSGREKSVPVLAASSGKAIVMPLRSGQTVGDWMRG
jgi:hypothetical protein